MLLVSVSLGHIDSELYTMKQFASATFSLFGRFCYWRTSFILIMMLAKLYPTKKRNTKVRFSR